MHCAQHMDVVADDAVVTDAIAALSARTLSHVVVRTRLFDNSHRLRPQSESP